MEWPEGIPPRHSVTPVRGSARRLDGLPASLMNPRDYPVEALCAECGKPIRTEHFYSATWDHIDRFTMPPAAVTVPPS